MVNHYRYTNHKTAQCARFTKFQGSRVHPYKLYNAFNSNRTMPMFMSPLLSIWSMLRDLCPLTSQRQRLTDRNPEIVCMNGPWIIGRVWFWISSSFAFWCVKIHRNISFCTKGLQHKNLNWFNSLNKIMLARFVKMLMIQGNIGNNLGQTCRKTRLL